MWILRKRCFFEAGHYIPHHKGKCKDPHGHSYRVDFLVRASCLNADGFVVDFSFLSDLCKRFDHVVLNDVFPFTNEGYYTCAEHIARFLAESVLGACDNVDEVSVTVWETRDSRVTCTRGRL